MYGFEFNVANILFSTLKKKKKYFGDIVAAEGFEPNKQTKYSHAYNNRGKTILQL